MPAERLGASGEAVNCSGGNRRAADRNAQKDWRAVAGPHLILKPDIHDVRLHPFTSDRHSFIWVKGQRKQTVGLLLNWEFAGQTSYY